MRLASVVHYRPVTWFVVWHFRFRLLSNRTTYLSMFRLRLLLSRMTESRHRFVGNSASYSESSRSNFLPGTLWFPSFPSSHYHKIGHGRFLSHIFHSISHKSSYPSVLQSLCSWNVSLNKLRNGDSYSIYHGAESRPGGRLSTKFWGNTLKQAMNFSFHIFPNLWFTIYPTFRRSITCAVEKSLNKSRLKHSFLFGRSLVRISALSSTILKGKGKVVSLLN
jgi:hypothetical protein